MATSVNITSATVANKKVTKALSNINPEISNATLKQAAQLFTAISNTTYQSATRVTTMNVDEEYTPPVTKIEPTLTMSDFSYSGHYYESTITYNGDGELSFRIDTANAKGMIYNNTLLVEFNQAFTGKLYASEGTTYAAKSISFSYVP